MERGIRTILLAISLSCYVEAFRINKLKNVQFRKHFSELSVVRAGNYVEFLAATNPRISHTQAASKFITSNPLTCIIPLVAVAFYAAIKTEVIERFGRWVIQRLFRRTMPWSPTDAVNPMFIAQTTPIKPVNKPVNEKINLSAAQLQIARKKVAETLAGLETKQKKESNINTSTNSSLIAPEALITDVLLTSTAEQEIQGNRNILEAVAATKPTFSLKKLREEEKARLAALPKPSYAIRKYDPNDSSLIPAAAGLSVSLLALTISTPLPVLVSLGLAASFVAKKQDGDAADQLRSLGSTAISTLNYLTSLDEKYLITERTIDTFVNELESKLGPDGMNSLEVVYNKLTALRSALSDDDSSGKKMLLSVAISSERLLEALVETNAKYSIVEMSMSATSSAAQVVFNMLQSSIASISGRGLDLQDTVNEKPIARSKIQTTAAPIVTPAQPFKFPNLRFSAGGAGARPVAKGRKNKADKKNSLSKT